MTLNAGARVPASENYDLANRARLASRDGLALARPVVSYALSRARVDAIVGELMAEVLAKVGAQSLSFSETTGRAWRIGDVEFGVTDISSDSSRSGKGAYRVEEVGELLASLDDGPDGAVMAGSERVWIVAEVTLKGVPG